MKSGFGPKLVSILVSLFLVLFFQNCGEVRFNQNALASTSVDGLGTLGVCEGVSCDLTPLTAKPAVVTILMALGDEADSQLVVNGASAQLIAETVVRYASPVSNPRILLVMDQARGSEDPEDSVYAKEVLLKRYLVTQIEEPADGLLESDTIGYDLIWFNNPGSPMGSEVTRDTLTRFRGGVILQGDDLGRGRNFDNDSLTGLRYLDNGTAVNCAGTNYNHDNNLGQKFRVSLDPAKIPGADSSAINFDYGNDIDNTEPARADLEVVALALGGHVSCVEYRPAIVRYQKD